VRGRGVRGAVVAAAAMTAMAVLTASQAPGAVASASRAEPPAAPGASVSGDSPYRTELPPLRVADAADEGRRAAAGRAPGGAPQDDHERGGADRAEVPGRGQGVGGRAAGRR
ncbi:hypothetical protein EF905_25405, partial [Streptomyces sp. WAC05374]